MATTKPSRALVRAAKVAGVELHVATKRKRGESLLDYRCRDWSIPQVTFAPIGDKCIVWRLPPLALSAGGIVIPEEHMSPHVKGILLAMGPLAMDELAPIEVGHVVIFGRFAGWEHDDVTPEHMRHNRILEVRSKDINGSDDLKADLEAGRIRIVKDTDGRHKFARVVPRKELPPKPKAVQREKLERLANGTTNPHEADAARRAAERLS